MSNEKVILFALFSGLIDFILAFILTILGIPDPTDLLIGTGMNAINATLNALPSNAPSQSYTAANTGLAALSAIRFAEFLGASLAIAIPLGFLFVLLATRNDD
jgi:hypothetical protein